MILLINDCYVMLLAVIISRMNFVSYRNKHVIPKEGIKGDVSSITVVDNETIEIDEGEYYLLLALENRSTDTTSPNEADEEPFAESVDGQGDKDLMTMDADRSQRKRKRTVILAPVVQTLGSAIHRINHYPVDKY